jgi:hypothetical protein
VKLIEHIARYIKNYRSRHRNNVSFALHIIGVPQVFIGLCLVIIGKWKIGLLNFFLGYLWQWIGHTYFEKDEMGEIIGIKNIIKEMRKLK